MPEKMANARFEFCLGDYRTRHRTEPEKYLGGDEAAWRAYDATSLIEDGHRVRDLLVDQGTADGFLG